MKNLMILTGLFLLTASGSQCSRTKVKSSQKFKAKLETKALCMNYTLTVTSTGFDTSLVVDSWTDENTGKTFRQAFALANPCNFPKDINEGDEFYFVIDSSKQTDCMVCMAYYPTPPRKLSIKVLKN
jgi:hypothetical protein